MIASKHPDEYSALFCALFSYGKASSIVNFLNNIDFSLIDAQEHLIRTSLSKHYYRFQNTEDIINIMITLRRLKREGSLETLFLEGYEKNFFVLDGVNRILEKIKEINPYTSRGYRFLIGSPLTSKRFKGVSAYKRWNMYLRWMVRRDNLDLGLWEGVDKKDLILPLDTHTFAVSRKLGLCTRKSCDLEAALLITQALKNFDKDDPVKYDFALYRLGQEKIL